MFLITDTNIVVHRNPIIKFRSKEKKGKIFKLDINLKRNYITITIIITINISITIVVVVVVVVVIDVGVHARWQT